jgi:hypothetical protein
MADNFNREELENYNDNLREAVNYSRQLSENILKLAGRMANLSAEARMTRRLTSELESDIKKTITLTDKLYAGKLKEREAQRQLNQLSEKYRKYVEDAADSTTELGKYLAQNAQDQLNYQNRLNQSLQEESNLKSDIRQADLSIDASQRAIATLEAQQINANATQVQLLQDQINQHKDIVKQLNQDIRANETLLRIKQKDINKTQEQLTATEKIIEANQVLIDQYNTEIQKGEKLLKNLKEQGKTTEGLAETFKDVKALLNPFAGIFEFIKKIAFTASDQVTRIQKGLVVSREEAYELRQGFNDAAVASGNIAVNTERMVAANAELGKQLGFNSRFSNDMNVEFIKLTKQIGLSDEAAGGLAKLTKASGMDFKTTKNTVLETTQRLSSQYGIQLDQKDILEEIGKISGQTLAMLKGNPKALAEAVAQARLLGTNLDTVKKQASSLLDFETSIENELQAELITGRQFNLERARAASLTGDLTTTMKELNSQGIDFNNFSNMNVIAQEKIAGMLGMQTDELSDQLLKQKYMGMSQEQVAALAGEEVAKRLEALSAQDKFNLAMEKMQDIVSKIAGGPFGKLADMLATMLGSTTGLVIAMSALAGISMTKLIVGLAASAVQAGMLTAGAISANAALTFGVGTALVVAAIAAGMLAYSGAKEQAATPAGDMFSSKGKTLVSPKEGGLFSLSDNDEFAAAPGLGDMISSPRQQTTVVQDNSLIVNAIASLNDTMKGVKDGVGQLYNKSGTIIMSGDRVGTALVKGNYNLA